MNRVPEIDGYVNTFTPRSSGPWVRHYPSEARSNGLTLNWEQRGVLSTICDVIYETGQRIPLNDSLAAKMLGGHTNAYRKVRDQLAALGKIVRTDDGWTVPRAEQEYEFSRRAKEAANVGAARRFDGDARQDGRASLAALNQTVRDTVGVTPTDTPLDTPPDTPLVSGGVFSKNFNKINVATNASIEKNREEKKEQCSGVRAKEVSEPGKIDSVALSKSLMAVAEPCLDDRANLTGLISCAVPMTWLAAGCDLDLDVLPTLTALGRQRAGKRVRTWAYFTDAVYEARDQRLAGMRLARPVPEARPLTKLDADEYLRRANEHVAAEQAEHRRQKAIRDAEDAKRAEQTRKFMASLRATESAGGVADVAF